MLPPQPCLPCNYGTYAVQYVARTSRSWRDAIPADIHRRPNWTPPPAPHDSCARAARLVTLPACLPVAQCGTILSAHSMPGSITCLPEYPEGVSVARRVFSCLSICDPCGRRTKAHVVVTAQYVVTVIWMPPTGPSPSPPARRVTSCTVGRTPPPNDRGDRLLGLHTARYCDEASRPV